MAKSEESERRIMTNQVIVVTDPDDTLIDGFRLATVDLTSEQSKLISDILLDLNFSDTVILYSWKIGENTQWLLDKKSKSDVIIFNADSLDQTIAGYMSAQKNSYYMGTLKSIGAVNKRAIYSSNELQQLLNTKLNNYE